MINKPFNVEVISAGYSHGNLDTIKVNGISIVPMGGGGRGLNVAVLDEADGSTIKFRVFDTNEDSKASEAFVSMINGLPLGRLVAIAVKDEATNKLTEEAKKACESIGSTRIRQLGYRGSWAIVGRKGGSPLAIAESMSNNSMAICAFGARDTESAISISARSAGQPFGDLAQLACGGCSVRPLDEFNRGFNVAVWRSAAEVPTFHCFDTHGNSDNDDAFAAYLESIPSGSLVAIAVKDSATGSSQRLSERALRACESIGSLQIRNMKYRGSWAIIGKKGAAPGFALEQQDNGGPTSVAMWAAQGQEELITLRVEVKIADEIFAGTLDLLHVCLGSDYQPIYSPGFTSGPDRGETLVANIDIPRMFSFSNVRRPTFEDIHEIRFQLQKAHFTTIVGDLGDLSNDCKIESFTVFVNDQFAFYCRADTWIHGAQFRTDWGPSHTWTLCSRSFIEELPLKPQGEIKIKNETFIEIKGEFTLGRFTDAFLIKVIPVHNQTKYYLKTPGGARVPRKPDEQIYGDGAVSNGNPGELEILADDGHAGALLYPLQKNYPDINSIVHIVNKYWNVEGKYNDNSLQPRALIYKRMLDTSDGESIASRGYMLSVRPIVVWPDILDQDREVISRIIRVALRRAAQIYSTHGLLLSFEKIEEIHARAQRIGDFTSLNDFWNRQNILKGMGSLTACNVVFVDVPPPSTGKGDVGQAGQIFGLPMSDGKRNGVAIPLPKAQPEAIEQNGKMGGFAIAHEIGHWLGLTHESAGPEQKNSNNLMRITRDYRFGGDKTELDDIQKYIILHHPQVRVLKVSTTCIGHRSTEMHDDLK